MPHPHLSPRTGFSFEILILSMHLLIVHAVIGSGIAFSAEMKWPQTYYVQVERAEVYAGPDKHYYPTGHLKRGDAIEIFQATESGWYGIRPPGGSFSWLPASQGFLLPGGKTVEVTDESAVSWIGTELGTAKQFRWQIQLQRGEKLNVLDEATINRQDEPPALWYKITPPNGEFRWIRSEAVSFSPPTMIAQPRKANESAVADSAESLRKQTSSVEPASFRESAAPTKKSLASKSNNTHSANQQQNSRQQPRTDPWAGFHAFDFTASGLKFLGFANGQQQKPQSRQQSSMMTRSAANSNGATATNSSDDAIEGDQSDFAKMIKQRGWRDPRDLRARRLANEREYFDSDAESFAKATVDSPVYDSANKRILYGELDTTTRAVLPASTQVASTLDRPNDIGQPDDYLGSTDTTNDNWYGIQQAASELPAADSQRPYLALTTNNLNDIHLAVSQIVAQPMSTWSLAPLAERSRYLVEHGATALERGEARLLLERIESFQSLATRNATLVGAPVSQPGNLVQTGQLAPLGTWNSAFQLASAKLTGRDDGSNNAGDVSGTASLTGRATSEPTLSSARPALPYDATGWLVPVHSEIDRHAEMYALTDDSGKVIVYVSPIAGLNLGRFLNQPVGIYGLRGYLPRLKTNHVEAQRVVRLR